MPTLPTLTTPEDFAVLSDLLAESGWPLGGCLPVDPDEALRALWKLCPDRVLHELGCQYAERVLPIFEQHHPDDMRPRQAIAAKWAWLRGELSEELLEVARQAAMAAARECPTVSRMDEAVKDATWATTRCSLMDPRAAAMGSAYLAADVAWASSDRGPEAAHDAEVREQLRLTTAYMLEAKR